MESVEIKNPAGAEQSSGIAVRTPLGKSLVVIAAFCRGETVELYHICAAFGNFVRGLREFVGGHFV